MRTEEQKIKQREASKRYRENNSEKFKASQKKYREKNKEKLSLSQKEWRNKNPEKYSEWYWKNETSREKKKTKHREWLGKNKEKQLDACRLQRIRNPEKVRARNILRKAVYEGKITKPIICEQCMKEKSRIEGHHDDYSKPLDVKWLCVSCHRAIHFKKEVYT